MPLSTDANVELICSMIDEAYEPSRMKPEEAREFLVLLRDEILSRIETLCEENPELIRQARRV
jgi:hypothetical protein